MGLGALIVLLTNLGAGLATPYLDKRTADLVKMLQDLVGVGAAALSRLGQPITQDDLLRWQSNAEERDRILSE